MPRAGGARVVEVDIATLVVVVLFAVQLNYVADRIPGASVWDDLDTGFYVAGIAALSTLVSGFMPSGWMRRRSSESDTATKRRRHDDHPMT